MRKLIYGRSESPKVHHMGCTTALIQYRNPRADGRLSCSVDGSKKVSSDPNALSTLPVGVLVVVIYVFGFAAP